jgi:hypothetical protein
MEVSGESREIECCGAPLLKATSQGLELTCEDCNETTVIPYEALRGKEQLMRFMKSRVAGEEPHPSKSAGSPTRVLPRTKRARGAR